MLAPRTDSFLWFIDTLLHQSLCFSVCMVETTPLVIPLIHSIYDDTLQIFSADFAISDHHNGQRKERIGYTYIYNPLNYIRSVEREGKCLCHPPKWTLLITSPEFCNTSGWFRMIWRLLLPPPLATFDTFHRGASKKGLPRLTNSASIGMALWMTNISKWTPTEGCLTARVLKRSRANSMVWIVDVGKGCLWRISESYHRQESWNLIVTVVIKIDNHDNDHEHLWSRSRWHPLLWGGLQSAWA